MTETGWCKSVPRWLPTLQADRLVSATGGGNTVNFKYDFNNRRIQQSSSASTQNYLWDEKSQFGDVVLEGDSTWGNLTSYTLGSGEMLWQTKGATNCIMD